MYICGRPIAINVHFDGGHTHGRGSSAWTMAAAWGVDEESVLQWRTVAEAATYHDRATSVSAELIACLQAVHVLSAADRRCYLHFQFYGAAFDARVDVLTINRLIIYFGIIWCKCGGDR